MNATNKHISLEAAKLLKDCGLDANMYYWKSEMGIIEIVKVSDEKYQQLVYLQAELYPAYTWAEILWKYHKEFFGNDVNKNSVLYAHERYPILILKYLQEGKVESADKYFRENCILIK